LSFGAGTFGGRGPLFSHWGTTDTRAARRLVDLCIDAGLNMFDTADAYSDGASEGVLGEAIRGWRDSLLISTKLALPTGEGPNEAGTSRWRLLSATDAALRRLQTDHIRWPSPSATGIRATSSTRSTTRWWAATTNGS
jgi:aryl-alcohol dehydrogenase-like predicted oxidoreductase